MIDIASSIKMETKSQSQTWIPYIIPVWLMLVIDRAINLPLVSSMVAFIEHAGSSPFQIEYPAGSTFLLVRYPAHLVVNQGHTTNGANGTVVVLVGFGGLIALILENRSRKKYCKSSRAFYLWTLIAPLSCLLTLTTLIYTFIATAMTRNQTINLDVAHANPAPTRYRLDDWTPQNWYIALLNLPLASSVDRHQINKALRLARSWRYNLIPMLILGFVLPTMLVRELRFTRKASR